MGGEVKGPLGGDVGSAGGWDGREVVAVGVVVGVGRLGCVGFVLGDSVEIDDAAAKVDAVAGDSDDSFNEDGVLAVWIYDRFVKDYGLSTMKLTVGHEMGQ